MNPITYRLKWDLLLLISLSATQTSGMKTIVHIHVCPFLVHQNIMYFSHKKIKKGPVAFEFSRCLTN